MCSFGRGVLLSAVCVLLVSAFTGQVYGQWVRVCGPWGTDSSGTSWRFNAIDTGLGNIVVGYSSNIGGNYSGGVFYSHDNGTNWSITHAGLSPVTTGVLSFADGANLLFAGTGVDFAGNPNSGGVFQSVNDSLWKIANTGLPNIWFTSLIVVSYNGNYYLFAGSYGNGIFVCNNPGSPQMNWSAVNNGLIGPPGLYVQAFALNGNNLFAGTNGGGIFLSTNNGASWNPVNNGLPNLLSQEIRAFAVNGNNIFAGTGQGVFLSKNNGTSWNAVSSGLPSSPSTSSLAMVNNVLFVGIWGRGIYRSTDSGSSWTSANMPGQMITSLKVIGDYLFATSSTCIWRRPIAELIPPMQPVLLLPNDGAINVAVNPTFNWNMASGATSYSLQVSTSSAFSTLIINQNNITDTSYVASGLLSSTSYYWRVNAKNTGGTSTWSSTWQFTTIYVAPPQTPTLTSPANNVLAQPVTLAFTWNSTAGANTYALQVSSDSNFSSFVYNQSNLTVTSQNVGSLTNNTTYYWRVNATNAGGTSPWALIWNFTTIVALPGQITLVAPNDTAKIITDSTFLIWRKGDASVMKYLLNFATDSGMVNV